jgi:hypothetical protein
MEKVYHLNLTFFGSHNKILDNDDCTFGDIY